MYKGTEEVFRFSIEPNSVLIKDENPTKVRYLTLLCIFQLILDHKFRFYFTEYTLFYRVVIKYLLQM